jgi:hypothetical protein
MMGLIIKIHLIIFNYKTRNINLQIVFKKYYFRVHFIEMVLFIEMVHFIDMNFKNHY